MRLGAALVIRLRPLHAGLLWLAGALAQELCKRLEAVMLREHARGIVH